MRRTTSGASPRTRKGTGALRITAPATPVSPPPGQHGPALYRSTPARTATPWRAARLRAMLNVPFCLGHLCPCAPGTVASVLRHLARNPGHTLCGMPRHLHTGAAWRRWALRHGLRYMPSLGTWA